MRSDPVLSDSITFTVDRRVVRDAVLDLRCQTVLALAAVRDILDRLDDRRRDLVPEVRP